VDGWYAGSAGAQHDAPEVGTGRNQCDGFGDLCERKVRVPGVEPPGGEQIPQLDTVPLDQLRS
jgi:hypothetical protein